MGCWRRRLSALDRAGRVGSRSYERCLIRIDSYVQLCADRQASQPRSEEFDYRRRLGMFGLRLWVRSVHEAPNLASFVHQQTIEEREILRWLGRVPLDGAQRDPRRTRLEAPRGGIEVDGPSVEAREVDTAFRKPGDLECQRAVGEPRIRHPSRSDAMACRDDPGYAWPCSRRRSPASVIGSAPSVHRRSPPPGCRRRTEPDHPVPGRRRPQSLLLARAGHRESADTLPVRATSILRSGPSLTPPMSTPTRMDPSQYSRALRLRVASSTKSVS
jgi:hypothetical protein